MKKKSSLRLVVAFVATAALSACGEHAGPTSPATGASTVLFGLHATTQTQLLGPTVAQCLIPYDVWVSKRIGPAGGTLDLGDNNTIVFPAGALLTETTITAHIPAGHSAKAFFTPEGLHFVVPAIVTLNYSACITPTSLLAIVYLQADTVSEVRPTQTNPNAKTVTATINHFSSYAVSY